MRRSMFAAVVLCLVAGAFAKPPLPRPAPELTVNSPDGKTLTLASLTGRVVLVQFLYTTCPHCQMTSRSFAELQNELGPQGLQVVGIAFNEEVESNPSLLRAYGTTNGVTFPLGLVSRDAALKFLGISVMSRFAVPQVVVIDRTGTIRAQSDELGSEELMNELKLRPMLQDLLKESPVSSKAHKTVKVARTESK